MSTNIIQTPQVKKKGFYLTTLDWKEIAQKFIDTVGKHNKLSIVFSTEQAINGQKQFLQTALTTGGDYNTRITIEDFNADEINIYSTDVRIDFRKKYKLKTLMAGELILSFSTLRQKEVYKKRVIKALLASLTKDLFNERMKALITGKLPVMVNKNGTMVKGTEDIVFDQVITLASLDKTSETDIKECLYQIRQALLDFGTASLTHTQFVRDLIKADRKNLFYGKYDAKDFIMIWNTPHYNKLGNITANLFNKDDILFTQPKQIKYAFHKIADRDDETKTLQGTENIVGFLIHKKALVEIIPASENTAEWASPNWTMLHLVLFIYGYGRLPAFPIVKIEIAGSK